MSVEDVTAERERRQKRYELKRWSPEQLYSEPVHAAVYTPEDSPDAERVAQMHREMGIGVISWSSTPFGTRLGD